MNFLRVSYRVQFIGMLALVMLAFPAFSQAAIPADCQFNRLIEEDMEGEDVRCMQKYLNASGFTIAETGPGSVGKETTEYRTLTKAALIKWQKARGLTPAIGMFGEKSKAEYLKDLAAQLLATNGVSKPVAIATVVTPTPTVAGASTVAKSADQTLVEKNISDSLIKIINTTGELKDLRDSNPKKADASENEIQTAMKNLLSALKYYFDGNYIKSNDLTKDVAKSVVKTTTSQTSGSSVTKTENLLNDIEDLYNEVDDKIAEAEDDGDEVGDAQDLLEDAGSLLDDAWDAFDDEDYKQATNDALDAEELLNNALDEIGGSNGDEADAEKSLDKAWKEYKNIKSDVSAAEDDGDDMDDAWDYLDEAKDLLKDADTAFDDEDYDEVMDLVDEAMDLIADAEDEL